MITKKIKQQLKLTFNGIPKFHKNIDSYTFEQNEFFRDQLIYLQLVVIEMSKLLTYET